MKTLKVALVLLLLAAAGKLAYFYSGAYDIGADAPHWPVTERILGMLRERSIETRAAGMQVPRLDDPALIAEGAIHYGGMCMACHLAPGLHDTEIRKGLYPQPPRLTELRESDPREQFWTIKHGVKLTAMPAWGRSHDDDAIWSIVAFLNVLPSLTPEQFRQMAGEAEEDAETAQEDGMEPDAVVDGFLSALAAGKAEEATRWLAPDVLVYESGHKESSRDEYVAQHLEHDMEFMSKATVERLERAVGGGEDTVWVTSRMRVLSTTDGKPVDAFTNETMVLMRDENGEWRIRHIHWSSTKTN
jgi:mono/diheme cytochrome c family protein